MRKSLTGALIAGCVLVVVLNQAVRADTLVDTNPGNTTISNWGPTATFQYGQVVTVPTTDAILQSFSFTFNSDTAFNFNADVAAWNGVAASGPVLFSDSQSTSDIGSNHTYTINTGGLALTPGEKYVLFFDAYGGGSGKSTMAGSFSDPYGGGTFVYANNITANLTSGPWSLVAGNIDAALTADFASAVPAPSSLLGGLALLGVFGVGTIARNLGRFARQRSAD